MIFTILGKSGSGKSYLGREITNKLTGYTKNNPLNNTFTQSKKLFIFDESYDHVNLGDISVLKLDNDIIKKINTDKLIEKYERLLINTEFVTETDLLKDFINRFSKSVWNQGNIILLVDEAHIYYPERQPAEELEKLLKISRKRGIDIIFITQQFRDIRKAAINQCSVLCLGKFFGINEIETAKKYGITKDMVLGLNKYEFIFIDAWDSGQVEILENKEAI